MFEIDCEKYDNIKESLKELLQQLEIIDKLDINSKEYKIKYKVGCDMKMLAILFGINAANSNFSCLWCNCNLSQPVNMQMEWSISRTQADASTHHLNGFEGYTEEPIIKFVDFDCIVIDTLHLLLRISDKLFNLLLKKIDLHDQSDSADLNNRPVLKCYIDFLKNVCKLTKPFYLKTIDNVTKIKFRNFSGSERLKIFENFFKDFKTMNSFFPSDFLLDTESAVWLKFYNIFKKIKTFSAKNPPSSNFENDLKEWLEWYMLISDEPKITPYIHSFVFHLTEFLRIHSDVNLFNAQGLEKLNDLTMQYYQTSTNKHRTDNAYLVQLLKKRNRIEFFSLKGKLSDFIPNFTQ